ncbi:MAG: sigma 54-interacting transcriptional regulator, partial [Victivallales bacterium]|nr:sigma 54-interacting transcriptional regulator [Victivallales bacterium]
MKILYTWTGYRELKEAGKKFPQYCTLIEEHIRNNQISGPRNGRSQVRLALEQQKYDKLVILIDFAGQNFLEAESDFIAAYKETFENYKCDVQVFPVVLSKAKNNNEYSEAEDYAIVYQKTKEILEQTKQEGADLFFLLSSGTHAMTTSLILLGKTLFDGAKFLRDNGKLTEFTIPFDMTIDLAPHFYGRQDNFQFKIPESFDDIIGNSPAIKEAERKAAKAAIHEVNVLLIGESGTGKEL